MIELNITGNFKIVYVFVYCNIYPEGRPVQSWINSFYDAGGGRPIVTYM